MVQLGLTLFASVKLLPFADSATCACVGLGQLHLLLSDSRSLIWSLVTSAMPSANNVGLFALPAVVDFVPQLDAKYPACLDKAGPKNPDVFVWQPMDAAAEGEGGFPHRHCGQRRRDALQAALHAQQAEAAQAKVRPGPSRQIKCLFLKLAAILSCCHPIS